MFSLMLLLTYCQLSSYVVFTTATSLSSNCCLLKSEVEVLVGSLFEGAFQQDITNLAHASFIQNASCFLRHLIYDYGVGIDGTKIEQVISIKITDLNSSSSRFVEAVDGKGEGFTCIVGSWRNDEICLPGLIGYSNLDVRFDDFRMVVKFSSENGDFQDTNGALFHLERGFFGSRSTTHTIILLFFSRKDQITNPTLLKSVKDKTK